MSYYRLMMYLVVRNWWRFLVVVCLILVVSCARKGRPSGGPKDITPPELLRATPDTFSTNIPTDLEEITLDFDEYVRLQDYTKNVIISPPISPPPIFSPSGIPAKEVTVSFSEPLKDETTYTINFGQSIQDNNEGNPLSYFTYVFSTGDKIDSLEVQGSVVNLGEREMPENVVAALYRIDSTYNDSIILHQKPYYVAKLDSANRFDLKYLREGDYRLIAFDDETPNMQFDPRNEKFAFYPEPVQAGSSESYELNLYTPTLPYRAKEVVQADYGKLEFYFDGHPEHVKVIPLEPQISTGWAEHKPFSDTLTYYYNPSIDSISDKNVRMKFAVKHNNVIDSLPPVLYNTETYTALKVYGRNLSYAPGKAYEIEANYPLDTLHKDLITVISDSLDLDFSVRRMKSNKFVLDFPIAFDKKYKIEVLPGAAKDYMHRTNDTLNLSFGVKNEKDYGHLKLKIANAPSAPFWLKLMSAQDKEIASVYGTKTQHEFRNLTPGDYYFQLVVDENSNGRYETGSWDEGLQPEKIYLYPTEVTVRAYWEVEETWVLGGEETSTSDSESNNPEKKSLDELQVIKPKVLEQP